jgi:hypothetical protein
MLDSPDKLTDTESDSGVPQGTQPVQPNIKIDRKNDNIQKQAPE